MYSVVRHSTSNPVNHIAQIIAMRNGCCGSLNASSTDAFAVGRLEAGLQNEAVRDDVEAPPLEITNLVLSLADHDLDDRFFHPCRLAADSLEGRGEPVA